MARRPAGDLLGYDEKAKCSMKSEQRSSAGNGKETVTLETVSRKPSQTALIVNDFKNVINYKWSRGIGASASETAFVGTYPTAVSSTLRSKEESV